MKLEGVFQCVRCGGQLIDLRISKGEGTVCIDEDACALAQEMGDVNGRDRLSPGGSQAQAVRGDDPLH